MPQWSVAGAMGAVIGHTLGAPRIGTKEFRRLNFFEPIPVRMASSPVLESWLVWSHHLRSGRPAATLSYSWYTHWNYPTDESAFGLANCARGFGSPLAGSFANPLPGGSNALGRCAYWGLVFSGQPERAREYAFFDSSLDHAGDAVHLGMAVAQMVSETTPETDFPHYVRILTKRLPTSTPILKVLPDIIAQCEKPDGPSQIRLIVNDKLGVPDPLDANATMAWILAGLGQLRQGFGASIMAAAGCGGASDQAALIVGTIAGLRSGVVDTEWASPLGSDFVCGTGLRGIDPPRTLAEFAEIVSHDADRHAVSPADPVSDVTAPEPDGAMGDDISAQVGDMIEAESDGEEEAVPDTPTPFIVPEFEVPEGLGSTTEVAGILITVTALTPPVVVPGQSIEMTVAFRNAGTEERVLKAELTAPDGWKVATQISSFRLLPGQTTSYPVVAHPAKEHPGTADNLRLRFEKYELLLPLAGSQTWYAAGPFVNHDGNGFEKVYGPESKQSAKDIFNGRSDLAIRWQPVRFPGSVFEIEPLFRLGPGVVYLYARVRFARPGHYRVVAATHNGLKMWVDGTRVVSFHDVHEPVPRPKPPYLGEFSTTGECQMLVKVLRCLTPAPPMTIYFLGEDGRLVQPEEFLQIE